MTQRTKMIRAALLTMLACLLGAQSAAASSKQDVFFEAPRDLTAGTATDATRAAAFAKLDELGVRALRVNLRWYDVAPGRDDGAQPAFDATDPGAYAWGAYDSVIETAKAKGWKVLISLSSPVPKWATEAKADNLTRPIPAEFGKFATAAARHYGSANVLWSIWNEPNLPRFLLPQAVGGKVVSPTIYRNLFLAGRDGIRAAGQKTPVLFGELAPVGGARDTRQYPLSFLRAAFCLSSKDKYDKKCGAKLTLDGIAHHPYQFSNGKLNKNDVTYRNMSRMISFLDKAAKAKAINSKVPVYYTEFGIQSYPDKTLGVSPQRQYEMRARAERDAYANSRIRGFSQYLLTDDEDLGGFQTGLVYATGKNKPSFDAFRLTLDVKPTGSGKRKKLSLWGLVRPAAGKKVNVAIERKVGKRWSKWKTVKTNTLGTFTASDSYRSSAQYRYRWTSPTGKLTSPPSRPYAG
ncbi:MAG: cellulase family glycosylhydrolase [Patulibacter minatonensis]